MDWSNQLNDFDARLTHTLPDLQEDRVMAIIRLRMDMYVGQVAGRVLPGTAQADMHDLGNDRRSQAMTLL